MRFALHKRVFLNFVWVITLFAVIGSFLGTLMINKTVLGEAQRRVSLDLKSAWSILDDKLDSLQLALNVLAGGKRVHNVFDMPDISASRAELELVRRQCGFDFLAMTDAGGKVILRTIEPYRVGDYISSDPVINSSLRGQKSKGICIYSIERLRLEGGDFEERAFVVFEPTEKAKPRAKQFESSGMAMVASTPVWADSGKMLGVLYAGILLNRNHKLIDQIHSTVFEDQLYAGRPLGTVTIFQWDTRIATNVVSSNNNRAIGTRLSQDVYDKVLENDSHWYDRAFVVNDWYLSAYDPIHDPDGKVIGSLYVGVRARKYDDLKWSLWKIYGSLSFGVAVLVMAVGLIFARRLTGSITRLADAAASIADGDFQMKVPEPGTDDEILDLTKAFNAMVVKLEDRETKINDANQALERTNISLSELNSRYIDMLGFVSHELKNTLGVIYTSAHALEKGMVGPLTQPQSQLIENISRNINAAVKMTKNYLDLARIEKGELDLNKRIVNVNKDIVNPLLAELHPIIAEKRIKIENLIGAEILVACDPELIHIVYKNLLDNAVKYSLPEGLIRLEATLNHEAYRFEVYNQGEGLTPEQIEHVFEKFVKYKTSQEAPRSTGLGLFIARQIVKRHQGRIWVESQPGEFARFFFTLPLA